MKLLDLFSGIGGFSLAAHWMGWKTVAFVEKEKFCQKVLRKNFGATRVEYEIEDATGYIEINETWRYCPHCETWSPAFFLEWRDGCPDCGKPVADVITEERKFYQHQASTFVTGKIITAKPTPIYDDIFEFSGKPFRGRVDIVTGGFPCQPFSAAGKRKGRNDERHLFPEMLRVIREVQPRWVVAENVRGLLSIESGSVFAEVVASLEGEGFEVVTFCIPASAVEAPHRRDRLWIVAHANGLRKHSECREIQISNGKISERYDDAKPCNADIHAAVTKSSGRSKGGGFVDSGNGEACGERSGQSSRSGRGNVANAERISGRAGLREAGKVGHGHQLGNGNRDAADAGDTRLQGNELGEALGEGPGSSRPITKRFANEHWYEAAIRLCTLGDGLPGGLPRPKGWRVNALKAVGNSIVPQIAFEIFRAIEAAEKES